MNGDKLAAQIEGQKMSQGRSMLDETAFMVPAVGIGVLVILMAGFYIYYRRKQNRHGLKRPARATGETDRPARSGRRRGLTLAESGGLPPSRSSGKGGTP